MNSKKESQKKSNVSPHPVPVASSGAGSGAPLPASTLLDDVIQHHKAGRLKVAEAGYREVLNKQPDHPMALQMLGVLEYQAGRYEEAQSLIERAQRGLPNDAGLCVNLANVLSARGFLEEAVTVIRNAISINPDFAMAYNNLGNALKAQGKLDQAASALQQAVDMDNGYIDAYVNLAAVHQASGELKKAEQCFQKAVELDPNNVSAAHMLAALQGRVTDSAPDEHVARLFDGYALKFDQHLVDTLGYSMPDLLREEIDRLQGADAHFHKAIDLGCGTGLAGATFRSITDHIKGLDLSERMIDKARDRNVYDDLQTGSAVDVLNEHKDRYDLFICADMFPYIGDVQPLFSAIADHAEEGALFAFSTEVLSEGDFTLRPTGRYAHSQKYLCGLAAANGFSVHTMRTENLRKHNEKWIEGDLVILQYR